MKKYSIVLPVRNGGEYVKECVNSILSQTLNEFTLHVLDNCSTDGTLEWITSLKDERIIITPSTKSLTIEENWARAVNIPKNEFLTLIGHDDVLEHDYLEVMDELILKYPDASLYQAHFNYIDSKGKIIRKCKPIAEIETAKDFLTSLLTNNFDVMGTGFMMRSRDYDAIGGIPINYPNLLYADFELLVNLTRISYKATSPKTCFDFRLHQSTTTVSPDVKLHKAFETFINFLQSLKTTDKTLIEVIEKFSPDFILFYCKGLSHRLLRTPLVNRDNLSVKKFIRKCEAYSQSLAPGKKFEPLSILSIWLAQVLDSSSIGRNLFLTFKKVYSKPVLQ
ncbi:glycosyltransferase family 2 protein [Segetibacter koreensis]|uniref:glycosyltransferase family 2 protein n=1 Tax=Segetibacter koreensis TaxID=398037 RepID=UPI00036B12D8|nr:glycosyltransferase [Segetibacter koreensis]